MPWSLFQIYIDNGASADLSSITSVINLFLKISLSKISPFHSQLSVVTRRDDYYIPMR